VRLWEGETAEPVNRLRQPQLSRALVAASVSAGEKTTEETGAVEVGRDENTWKRSAKKGHLCSISLFLFFGAGRSPLSGLLLLLERQTRLQVTVDIKILADLQRTEEPFLSISRRKGAEEKTAQELENLLVNTNCSSVFYFSAFEL